MKMKTDMLTALNAQANLELSSAYIYLSISYDMSQIGLKGFAHWLRAQYEEERGHAFKLFSFIETRDEIVTLDSIPVYDKKFTNPLDAAKAVLAHEQKVTTALEGLFTLARKEKDYATELFLNWFITEQLEEEANARELIAKFSQLDKNPGSLMHIDAGLGARQ